MVSALGIRSRELRQIMLHILSIALSTFILGIFTNIFSSLLEKIINLNPFTIFILVFLLFTTVGLAVSVQLQINEYNKDPEHPPAPQTHEHGLIYSLAFMVLIIFKGCPSIETFDPWTIVITGSIPVIFGKIMIYPYLNYVRSHPPAKSSSSQPTETGNEPTGDDVSFSSVERNSLRFDLPTALGGRLNVEHQHAIVVVIIETILSIKKVATQSEIFEACRRFKKGYLGLNFADTIQHIMFRYFHERQRQYKEVAMNTNDRKNWVIFEKPPKESNQS